MLMQPQNPQPNYNFILQDEPKPKRKLSSLLPKIPKPFGAVIAGVLVLFAVIIVYGLLSGNAKPSGLGDIAARAQEISRVSGLVAQASTDSTLKSLAVTAQTTTASNVSQIQSYMTKNKQSKLSVKYLALYKDSSTDTGVQTAAQNGSLGSYFRSYLKDKLTTLSAAMQTAFDSAKSSEKTILNQQYSSAQVLLTSL